MNVLFVYNTQNTFIYRLRAVLSKEFKLFSMYSNFHSPRFIIKFFTNAKKADLLWSEFISYHTFVLYAINLFLKKKMLIHIHGYETRVTGIRKSLFKKILLKADYIVCPSFHIQNRIKDLYGLDAIVIRNPLPSKEEVQPAKYSLIIASHTPNKRIIESIEYFINNNKNIDKRLIIISPYGYKKHRETIEKFIHDKCLDDQIEFVPYNFDSIENRGILSILFENCDEFILLSDNEGLNVSLTEARLFDKKIIISQIEPNIEANNTDIEDFSKQNIINKYKDLIEM